MRHIVLGAVLMLALAPALRALDDKDKPATPADELKALVEEQTALAKDRLEALKKAKTNEERKEVLKNYGAKFIAFPARFLTLAKKYPSDPVAVGALARVVSTQKRPETGEALELLRKNYLQSEGIGAACEALAHLSHPDAEKMLRQVLETNTHAPALGHAAHSLATALMTRALQARPLPTGEGTETRPVPTAEEIAKLNKEAEQLFERVLTKHTALKNSRGDILGDAARRDLNELRTRSPGMTVPDIEAEDVDGKKFKLSDYRGQVVFLDFWGHWCPPCRAMFSHNQALVKQMAGKPFALLGVNSDKDRTECKEKNVKEAINWRSFWNGPEGNQGPISKEWNVKGWPTIYVIDHTGVIRYKWLASPTNEAIDEVVNKLVAAAEKK